MYRCYVLQEVPGKDLHVGLRCEFGEQGCMVLVSLCGVG